MVVKNLELPWDLKLRHGVRDWYIEGGGEVAGSPLKVFLIGWPGKMGMEAFRKWCFQIHWTGLKINLSKSKKYCVGLVDNLGEIANVLGCGVDFFFTTYMGLGLWGAKSKSKDIWSKVIKKVTSCLVGWKDECLPKAIGFD
ncbi:hypothetical protein IFM89_025514 [Coptis chinensis]|uniref:Uncharacterized protein n=1 Tax=Coptis chinensis TaxID=261450 RepID=A0A835H7M4_9MAGN|nr:hypothetical protein IFM89_025514 [Coptis chinensis]